MQYVAVEPPVPSIFHPSLKGSRVARGMKENGCSMRLFDLPVILRHVSPCSCPCDCFGVLAKLQDISAAAQRVALTWQLSRVRTRRKPRGDVPETHGESSHTAELCWLTYWSYKNPKRVLTPTKVPKLTPHPPTPPPSPKKEGKEVHMKRPSSTQTQAAPSGSRTRRSRRTSSGRTRRFSGTWGVRWRKGFRNIEYCCDFCFGVLGRKGLGILNIAVFGGIVV